jgi:hypothetical protein
MPLERLSTRTAAAALRAQRTLPAGEVDVAALTSLLEQAGRRLVTIIVGGQRQVTVGWTDETRPVIDQETIFGPIATRSYAIAFAAALGMCWTDPSAPPYPGKAVKLQDVVRAAEVAGMSYAWAKGTLTNLLAAAGLVEIDSSGTLRLGTAVAALTPAQVFEFRRIHHLLPAGVDDEGDDDVMEAQP